MNIHNDLLTDGGRCMVNVGWTFHRDLTQTVFVNDDLDYLVLSLVVGGFHGNAGAPRRTANHRHRQQVAELSFKFETQCSRDCSFALLKVMQCYVV